MGDAPKRIAVRWEPGAAVTSGPLMSNPDYHNYILATPAALSEAPEVQALIAEAVAQERAEIDRLREALDSIARNTCCDKCQEAALVARAALAGGQQ